MWLFTSFHLNLMYSSIEIEQRPLVIERCYWPLLRLAEEYCVPIGIEVSGVTLEIIEQIDPEWIARLRTLVEQNRCELIGSGYAQLIGPLVPALVNAANLRLGNEVYERMIGVRPKVALVNEQAYSSGLIGHYVGAGYGAIIMDWNNPARQHHEWKPQWRYYPQKAINENGLGMPILWNNSITFQKFQRYAHGEMELQEFMDYLARTGLDSEHIVPLYGNDVEIFDFRPGRYHTEALLHHEGEWARIYRLFDALKSDARFRVVLPLKGINKLMGQPYAGNAVHLESPEEPIPVKKQDKYNITRWGVTGKDDLIINTSCWKIYQMLSAKESSTDSEWRELCYLWSSDFRTHITEKRWAAFRERLDKAVKVYNKVDVSFGEFRQGHIPHDINVKKTERFLEIETPTISITLNHKRGLAIEALCFRQIAEEPLCKTLPHGYYDDITFGADYYTGHLVFEIPGRPKVTDLNPAEFKLWWDEIGAKLIVSGTIDTPLGPVLKHIIISESSIALSYRLDWQTMPVGSLRLGTITLNPSAFDLETLRFRTHNGGYEMEQFPLAGKTVNHGAAASFLVSAKQSLGVTEGVVEISDAQKALVIHVEKTDAALLAQITHNEVDSTYFSRCSFSAQEMDETSRPSESCKPLVCSLCISAKLLK